MRLSSLLAATMVILALYAVVFQRPALRALASGDSPASVTSTQESAVPSPREPDRVEVVAFQSEARRVPEDIRLRALTHAYRKADVRAETTGRVIGDPVRRGSLVAEGEILCTLDPDLREDRLREVRAALSEAEAGVPEANAALDEARARLEQAQIEARAAEALGTSGFSSETRVASARAGLASARAGVRRAETALRRARTRLVRARTAVASAQEDIEDLDIRAPFDGILEEDSAEVGTFLQTGASCATVVDLDPIVIAGQVAPGDVGTLSVGAKVTAHFDAGTSIEGRVSFVARTADARTRTFRVEARLPNPDLAIREGAAADMVIQTGDVDAHFIPGVALTLDDAGRMGVRVAVESAQGDVARFIPVSLVQDMPAGMLVSGLPDTARIVVVGQEYISEGTSLSVTDIEDPRELRGLLEDAASGAVTP